MQRLEQVWGQFEEMLAGGDLTQSDALLAALEALSKGDAAVGRARIALMGGEVGDAERWLATAEQEGARDQVRFLLVGGQARLANQDAGGALAAFQSALEIAPGSVTALLGAGESLRLLGASEEAAHVFHVLVGGVPQCFEARVGLARVLGERGDVGGAMGQLEAALALDPFAVAVYEVMADLYVRANKAAQGVTRFEALIEEQPMLAGPGVKMVLARLCWEAGYRDKLAALLETIESEVVLRRPEIGGLAAYWGALGRQDQVARLAAHPEADGQMLRDILQKIGAQS